MIQESYNQIRKAQLVTPNQKRESQMTISMQKI